MTRMRPLHEKQGAQMARTYETVSGATKSRASRGAPRSDAPPELSALVTRHEVAPCQLPCDARYPFAWRCSAMKGASSRASASFAKAEEAASGTVYASSR